MQRLFVLLLVFVFLFCGCSDATEAPAGGEGDLQNPVPTVYKVGVNTLCIDPRANDGATLAGFGNANRRYDGNLDSIEVSCAVFEGNGVTFAIVSADILGWDSAVMANIRNQVENKLGFSGENILFNATHTHSGPTTQTNTVGIGVVSESYNQYLISQTFDCMQGAFNQREEMTLYHGTADASGIALNRRKEVNGTVSMLPNPEKECCEECDVLVGKKDGTVRLILFSFACHPSILNGNYMSSEYVGAARRVLETRYENATAMFIQGCGGDAKPNVVTENGDRFKPNDYSDVQIIGNRLAQSVVSCIGRDKIKPVAGDLLFKDTSFTLPIQKESTTKEEYLQMAEAKKGHYLYEVYMWYYENYDSLPTSAPYLLQRIDFGSGMTIVAMMGEVVWGYDKLISDLLPERNVLVAGYSNGVYGYICTTDMYDEGGYEPYGSTGIYQLSYGYPRDIQDTIMTYAATLCGKAAGGNNS